MWDTLFIHIIVIFGCFRVDVIYIGLSPEGKALVYRYGKFYFFSDGRIQVFHCQGERFTHNCLLEWDRFGGGC